MKSYPCAKKPGGGVSHSSNSTDSVPPSEAPPVAVLEPIPSDSCQYINAKGGRCRLFRSNPNSAFCPHHERQHVARQSREREATANELLSGVDEFVSAVSVNRLLGNLVKQLARKRISRRDAIAMAYVSQLLLTSVTAADKESTAKRKHAEHQAFLASITHQPRPYPPPAPAAQR